MRILFFLGLTSGTHETTTSADNTGNDANSGGTGATGDNAGKVKDINLNLRFRSKH